jgi:hypothetical protein
LERTKNSPWVCLAVDLNWLVPGPHVIDESLILLARGIELCEGVALVVWSNVECVLSIVAADEESATDDGVVGLSIDGGGTKDVLTASLETGKETAYFD